MDQLPHSLKLDQRSELTIIGVSEILRFDETEAVVQTDMGVLAIHGQDLKLRTLSLDGGKVAVSGTVSALIYEEPRAGGLLHRLFG